MRYLFLIMSLLYNLAVILLTGYVVFVLGRSGWWFLLAIFILVSPSITSVLKEEAKKDLKEGEFKQNG